MSAGDNLTPKQRRFSEEYVIDWHGTNAAIRAGYSKDTAYSIASENLKKPEIKAYIEELQQDVAKLCGVSAARNVLELKKIAYSSLAEFKDGWMTEKDFDELTDDQKSVLSEIQHTTKVFEGGQETIVKFKLHDKQRAIEIMNKMLGFNATDKLDITSKGEKIMTESERDQRIAELAKKLNQNP